MTAKFNIRPDIVPRIYAYKEYDPRTKGRIKIGYTTRNVEDRMAEHFPTAHITDVPQYEVIFDQPAMRNDGTSFMDHEVHKALKAMNIENVGGEWFKCNLDQLKNAYNKVMLRKEIEIERSWSFKMRPEQKNAVDTTKNYFLKFNKTERKAPHFLWNCKMRFGKTFAAYKLAEEMNWKRVLVLTYMPAVQNSWKEDLEYHTDFENWRFIDGLNDDNKFLKKDRKYVCFASFQDFMGKNRYGGLKVKNEWAHEVDWDCIILDEYHHGAWNEKSKQLYMTIEDKHESSEETDFIKESGISSWSKNQGIWSEDLSPLKTKHYLYLSGTPFKAIATGEFLEEQIYNWTYYDEQNAKENYKGQNNPYIALPKMIMLTYQMPESITHFVKDDEQAEFDLNEFFKAEGSGNDAKFKHENFVQKWLDLIRGHGFSDIYTNYKNKNDKPVLPFFDVRLRNNLSHTLWFLPSVAACHAMKNLLETKMNSFYNDTYELLVCAGNEAGIGVKALPPLRKLMSDPLDSKTITFTCGKLCTGVTVKPWSGVFMLRNTSSPEKYFQTAFRAQSSWTVPTNDRNDPNKIKIMKEECYLFDFSPNRSLKLITEYSSSLDLSERSTEEKIKEFIKFLPVLCFDGSGMDYVDADDVLDFGMVGISGSQLARKFQSARLINVDDITLQKILDDEKALSAVMSIEGFRNINQDIEKIISQSEQLKKLKGGDEENDSSKNKKKKISDEEKKQRSKRKEIQNRLRKFATRIPIFMYLTDYREEALEDVIKDIEPRLFRTVTGITKQQFNTLVKLGLFNRPLMNAAVLGFKRYENASLHYGDLTKHNRAVLGLEPSKGDSDERIGAYDTVITSQEFLDNFEDKDI